jgi:hypothetical protein
MRRMPEPETSDAMMPQSEILDLKNALFLETINGIL